MDIARMAQNAAAARRVGDDRTADYWTECVEVANLHEQVDRMHAQWDVMKGSPEHDGYVRG